MGRCGRPPDLQIRSAFEATRTAVQCLAEAYERLVPTHAAYLGCLQPAAHISPWPPTLNPDQGTLSVGNIVTALYARVSSDGQARGNTVASQLAELRARAAADKAVVGQEHSYVDEGYSGATLARPVLERRRRPSSSASTPRARPAGPALRLSGAAGRGAAGGGCRADLPQPREWAMAKSQFAVPFGERFAAAMA
jgi:hypothetical protein